MLDAAGSVIGHIEVVRTELTDTTDGFFEIPKPGQNWTTIALSDRDISLSDVPPF